MSELKAISSGEIYKIIEYEDCYRTDDLYYPKSEADKVIADMDCEIKKLKDSLDTLLKAKTEQIIHEVIQKTLIYGEGFIRVEDAMKLITELLHHKYKRCLAMARWCASRSASWCFDPADEQLHKSEFYDKWKHRWLQLAEKFKEKEGKQ